MKLWKVGQKLVVNKQKRILLAFPLQLCIYFPLQNRKKNHTE